LYLVCGERV
nr:Chain C, Insulin [Homo sapiens]4Z76_F Chain F, Insulin [Homo sapiens]4Z77_C Chain C, Insulin [Homo sapiens]4Z77_F Chain F, Insulin [Homo sapiens]